ncbi:hypothetical protein Tco_1194968 [Tanacetum coccineum]
MDELWFTLDVDLLRSALGITPKDSAHPFVAPPAGDLVIDFVNNLGYPEELQFARLQVVTDPDTQFFRYCGGVVTGTNIDYAELIWEEFVQAIKTFFSDAANLKVPTKKPKPHVIPYCRFTKLIICYLAGRHNIHKRPQSPLHITADDYSLGNLKFVPKGELDEKYLDMVARKPRQATTMTDEEGGKKKAPPADEEPQSVFEPQVEDDEYNLQRGIQMSLESFQAPVGGVAIREPDSGITQKLPVVEGKGKGIAFDELAAQSLLDLQKPKKKSTTDQYIFQRRTLVTQDASTRPSAQPQDDTSANVVHDTPSPADAKTGADMEKSNSEADTEILNVGEEQGEDVFNTVALEERTVEIDEGQAGSDPSKTPVS